MNRKHFLEQTKSEMFQELCYLQHKKDRINRMQNILCKKIDNVNKDWNKLEKEVKKDRGIK